jgi:site-specific DNA-cytosine methylase
MDNAALSEGTIHDNVETFQPRWPCDIVVGGFPCQDISAAGKQRGVVEGKRSCLYTHLVRVADQCGCPFIFMENVANIVGTTMVKAWSVLLDPNNVVNALFAAASSISQELSVVLGSLAEAGFHCTWTVIAGCHVGAPIFRPRWFLLGCRSREALKKLRDCVPAPCALADWSGELAKSSWRTWNSAAERCPPIAQWLLKDPRARCSNTCAGF